MKGVGQSLSLAMITAAISGCSTHPIQKTVTRKDTQDIVQKIRCETLRGLRSHHPKATLAETTTVIGYDFRFEITETDKASGGLLEVTNALTNGSVKFGFKGGAEKTRQSERFFRVVETLAQLREDAALSDPAGNCKAYAGDWPNLIYPMAGSLGMAEVMETYLGLSSSWKLDASPEKPTLFSDTVTFTTDVKAGLTPELALNAPAGGVRLTNASISGDVERKDIHKVTIALASVPPPAPPKGEKQKKTPSSDMTTWNWTLPPTSSKGPSDGAVSAGQAVIYELDRLRNRDDDRYVLDQLRLRQ